MTETDDLLRNHNVLLQELLVEVKKILVEMQTMNDITQRRLPYRWTPGDAKNGKKTNHK